MFVCLCFQKGATELSAATGSASHHDWTALMYSADHGNLTCTRLLVEAFADLNAKDAVRLRSYFLISSCLFRMEERHWYTLVAKDTVTSRNTWVWIHLLSHIILSRNELFEFIFSFFLCTAWLWKQIRPSCQRRAPPAVSASSCGFVKASVIDTFCHRYSRWFQNPAPCAIIRSLGLGSGCGWRFSSFFAVPSLLKSVLKKKS